MDAEALGVLWWMGTVNRHDGRNRDRHDGSGGRGCVPRKLIEREKNTAFARLICKCTYLLCEKRKALQGISAKHKVR